MFFLCVSQVLNVSTVQGLLGVNLADLKLFENSSVVRTWVVQQYQSDLNTLNIGLIGGKIATSQSVTPQSVSSQSPNTSITTSQTNQTNSANTTAQGKNTLTKQHTSTLSQSLPYHQCSVQLHIYFFQNNKHNINNIT